MLRDFRTWNKGARTERRSSILMKFLREIRGKKLTGERCTWRERRDWLVIRDSIRVSRDQKAKRNRKVTDDAKPKPIAFCAGAGGFITPSRLDVEAPPFD